MNRTPFRLFSFLFFAALIFSALAESQQPQLAPAKRTRIEAAVSRFMASTHAPGLSLAIVEKGELEWTGGFGLADLENDVPVSQHTLFRLGSISKSLTAVGALQLWERGQLDLDVPVERYCPAFPKKGRTITTREVMGHLGGIRHYNEGSKDLETNNTQHFADPIQAGLDFFKNDPLIAEPGTHFHYSTQGYTLVGCAMEGAAGERYVDFMRRHVLDPSGMDQTQTDNRFTILPYRTRFYRKTESGRVENAEFLDSSYKIPGGGWISSAEDMGRFEVAILQHKLLQRSTLDLMWTPLKPGDGSEDHYGLGWAVFDENGIHFVGHSGGQQGTSTDLLLAPEVGAGVVVLVNLENAPVHDLSRQILHILDGTAPRDPNP
jgi:serine beta-lactamase-like protein LACTB, mitochondrial